MVQRFDLLRYGLWGLLVATADANRREYHMSTTWLPHLLTNTFTLLLPDLYRTLVPVEPKSGCSDSAWDDMKQTVDAMVRDNPAYVRYIAPLALGYILSHPRFNIYKGKLSELRIAGLGLDAIPHSATAFALTSLVGDTVEKAASTVHSDGALSTLIEKSNQHRTLFSGAVLTAVTLWWETGEYLMHRHELALRGDVTLINMQWSWRDTLNDCAANLIGWGLALGWRTFQRNRRLRG